MKRVSCFSMAALAMAALIGALGDAGRADPVDAGHLKAELVADHQAIAPGATIHLALIQDIAPGWHTYWRNPGDAGQATTLDLTAPAGWRAGPLIWGTPKRLPAGPLMDYGYEGKVILPFTLTASPQAAPGSQVRLTAKAAFLACKDICVPQDASLGLTLPVVAGGAAPDSRWGPLIQAALAAAPHPGPLTAAMTVVGGAIKLSVTGAPVRGGNFPAAYFYPFDPAAIDQPQPQAIERGADGLTLTLAPGQAFKAAAAPTRIAGVLDLGARAYEIDAVAGPPLAGAAGRGPPPPAATPIQAAVAFLGAVGSAFLGGMILNLMPCVFPILSMKAVSLASHAHSGRAGQLQGLGFLAGVVVTFLGLAALLILARAAGQAVGWGFQLQSPQTVALLSLIMLLVALNLSGLFEVGAGLQAAAASSGLAVEGGALGSFFTGVLAVAVAAPCTAPFMAPAIGYALTQGPLLSLSIFLALGLGMAAPFTAIAFAPRLLRLLPRPGAWMAVFKKAMAFPMYGAAAWLLWVFSQQVGPFGLARLLAAAVLAGLGAWLYGRAQEARFIGKRGRAGFSATAVLALAVVAFAVWPPFDAPAGAQAAAASPAVGDGLVAEPFSPQRLAELRAKGKPVFVNFTAAWCVTCQVNDRLALSSPKVADAFRNAGMAYLKGDWTNRDAVIAQVLADHGRAGVPLYLVYGAGGREAVVLPQLLTEGVVLRAVQAAQR